ncbi:hypothetical protein MRX96_027005 [Rhipicephalus microplus]
MRRSCTLRDHADKPDATCLASCLPGSSRNLCHMHMCAGIRELRAVAVVFLRSEATPEKSLAVVAVSGFRGNHPGLLLSRRGASGRPSRLTYTVDQA